MLTVFLVYKDNGQWEPVSEAGRFLTKDQAEIYADVLNTGRIEETYDLNKWEICEEKIFVTAEQALLREYDGKFSLLPVNHPINRQSTYSEFDKKAV